MYKNRSTGQPFFDLRTRKVRRNRIANLNDGDDPVIHTPSLVEQMREFVAPIARQYGGTVVIDVAKHGDTGEPLIIELNTLPNSGLYASDVFALFERLIVAKDRGYRQYAFRERQTSSVRTEVSGVH